VADFFVRSMAPDMSTGLAPDLPDELGAALRQVPHVTGVEGASILEGRSGETGFVVIASELRMPPRLDLVAGDRRRIGQQMQAGQVVIGSVLAQRLRLGLGDFLELDTSQGPRKLPICGVANDYFAGGLTVQMSRDVAVKLLGVEGFDVYLLQAEPQHLPEVRAQLQAVCNQYGVLLHSFTEIARMIDTMIRGIVGCLWALVALGFAVGAFGVVNTLTMSVLEQTRELGLLRIVAMTKRQVRRTILTQALIIGAVGFTPGIIAGIGIAYVMNLAMLPTLGHWIPFGFHPWLALATLLGALASTSVAAWIPARRAANLDLVQALHYE
jgi:putative ABC transport system permease protein